jgi:peptidoglycan-associated lipoprotein
MIAAASVPAVGFAQETLPYDNGLATYHTAPRYRESEAHPLRVLAYIVHPIGWVAREVFFRPLSYFASSTETTRSVMGYREPFDYRQSECFNSDESVPDCRSIAPYNYDTAPDVRGGDESGASSMVESAHEVYFPDVNFDFNKRTLNELGKGKVHAVGELLKKSGAVKIVLEGHADYKGSDEYNQKLGMDRAEAVRAQLVAEGFEGANLATVSFGESRPLYAEQEDWARALNRRVSFKTGDAPVEEAKHSYDWQQAQ